MFGGIGLFPPAVVDAPIVTAPSRSSLVQTILRDPANAGVDLPPTIASGLPGAVGLYGAYRTLTNAQIQTLNSIPVDLVFAGATAIAIPIMGWARLITNVGYNTSSSLLLRYSGIATDICTAQAAFFTNTAIDKFVSLAVTATGSNGQITAGDAANRSIQLVGSNALTGGDVNGVCQIWLVYARVVVS